MKYLLLQSRASHEGEENHVELEVVNCNIFNTISEIREAVEEEFEQEREYYYGDDEEAFERVAKNFNLNSHISSNSFEGKRIGIEYEIASFKDESYDYQTNIIWTVVKIGD